MPPKSKKFKSMKFKSRFSGKPASSLKSSSGTKKSTAGKSLSTPRKRVVHKATKTEKLLRRNIRKGKLG